MSIIEILTNIIFITSVTAFVAMCFWTMHNLDKDDVKPKKHKKAKA